MAEESNIEELTSKLAEYVEQLSQIDELLKENPNDPELLKLKTDLEQIVALTHDLSQVPVETAVATEEAKWQVDDRCMAQWDGDARFYAATIMEIDGDDQYKISFLDYKQRITVTESAMKPYAPLSIDQLEKGALVRALFEEEELFYDGVVVEQSTASGFWLVRFPRFGRQVYEVSSYNIMPRVAKKAHNPDEPLPDKPVIPESLWAKPTDSEETLAQKKRKIKRIKQTHKKRKVEEAGQAKQSGWQNFQKKAKGAYGKKKKSIFRSSTTGTVGVVGSGKGMTSFTDRKSHQYLDPQLSVLDDE